MDAYRRAMRIIFDYLQRNLRPVQRVWVRSTPYGHAKCSRYTEPSKTPFAPTRKEGEFQWDMFEKMDQVWKVNQNDIWEGEGSLYGKIDNVCSCLLGND